MSLTPEEISPEEFMRRLEEICQAEKEAPIKTLKKKKEEFIKRFLDAPIEEQAEIIFAIVLRIETLEKGLSKISSHFTRY